MIFKDRIRLREPHAYRQRVSIAERFEHARNLGVRGAAAVELKVGMKSTVPASGVPDRDRQELAGRT
jgi:hypothetical protein